MIADGVVLQHCLDDVGYILSQATSVDSLNGQGVCRHTIMDRWDVESPWITTTIL